MSIGTGACGCQTMASTGNSRLPTLNSQGKPAREPGEKRCNKLAAMTFTRRFAHFPLGIGSWKLGVDEAKRQYLPGLSPIPMMLQAWITFTPNDFARASTSSSSAPGFSQTSGIPFRAMSSSTFTPMWPGT